EHLLAILLHEPMPKRRFTAAPGTDSARAPDVRIVLREMQRMTHQDLTMRHREAARLLQPTTHFTFPKSHSRSNRLIGRSRISNGDIVEAPGQRLDRCSDFGWPVRLNQRARLLQPLRLVCRRFTWHPRECGGESFRLVRKLMLVK